MTNGIPRGARARSDCARRSTYAGARGPERHSWLSAFWTKEKAVVVGAVQMVPVFGGAASAALNQITTGDLQPGQPGAAPVATVPYAMQAQIDQVNAFNAAEVVRLRNEAANVAFKLGIGATTAAAAAIGPAGNKYQTFMDNPYLVAGAIAGVGVLAILLLRK